MRNASIKRTTTETSVSLNLSLDGTGRYDISTGSGFFNHMMEQFTRHSGFDITLKAVGDTCVDCHHTVEDVGIVLGQGFLDALSDKKGICRYGSAILPMDESLVLVAVDISGRSHLTYDVSGLSPSIGDFDTELAEEFFNAFARSLGASLHLKLIHGGNTHHILEALFKGAGKALRQAVSLDTSLGGIPSTKGIL